MSFLYTTHPFSVAFGIADTRENCAASSELVFNRLMTSRPSDPSLSFNTIALIAVNKDGSLDEAKLKELVRLMRPDRESHLTLLDFCKSVDTIYKELHRLRASVASKIIVSVSNIVFRSFQTSHMCSLFTIADAARVDRAVERITNAVFYLIVGCVLLAVFGIDPRALFLSVSGFLLGFVSFRMKNEDCILFNSLL